MLALLYAYLIAPRGFRRVLHWFAVIFFLVVLTMVAVLFARILFSIPVHHGSILNPRPHEPWSSNFIHLRHERLYHAAKESL